MELKTILNRVYHNGIYFVNFAHLHKAQAEIPSLRAGL